MKRRDDDEKKKRSLDDKRMKKLKQKNLPKAMQIIANQSGSDLSMPQTMLVLPTPQISDLELSAIKKYTTGASIGGSAIDQNGQTSATRALMGNYSV